MTHICISKLTSISSDNGLSPGWRQAIIWTSARILLIGPLGTNFNDILIEIHTFLFKKMHLKMLSGKWRPFCLGLNVLKGNTSNCIISFILVYGLAYAYYIKLHITGPLWGETTSDQWITPQSVCNLEILFTSWCHHVYWPNIKQKWKAEYVYKLYFAAYHHFFYSHGLW